MGTVIIARQLTQYLFDCKLRFLRSYVYALELLGHV